MTAAVLVAAAVLAFPVVFAYWFLFLERARRKFEPLCDFDALPSLKAAS